MADQNIYETDASTAQYLHFHYGIGQGGPDGAADKALGFLADDAPLDFPRQTVLRLVDVKESDGATALDLGCAVGRSAFELSTHAASVVAIDLSKAFIDLAQQIADGRGAKYQLSHDGGSVTTHSVSYPVGSNPDRIEFRCGDAASPEVSGEQYDIVHASNLLCRLPDPGSFLDSLQGLVRPMGQLALATPSSWLPSFTPKENWPNVPILDYLVDRLDPHFELIRSEDIPFVIREHDRKFQLGISLGTAWRRRS